MYKVHRSEELDNWLKLKELPSYDDKEEPADDEQKKNAPQITLDEATEFVRMFWP